MLEPTTSLDEMNGLLSPDGKFYACEFTSHCELAHQICEESFPEHSGDSLDYVLHKLGWARLSCSDPQALTGNKWHIWDRTYSEDFSQLTQKQRDFIFDWCQHHGVELPDKMKEEMSVN